MGEEQGAVENSECRVANSENTILIRHSYFARRNSEMSCPSKWVLVSLMTALVVKRAAKPEVRGQRAEAGRREAKRTSP